MANFYRLIIVLAWFFSAGAVGETIATTTLWNGKVQTPTQACIETGVPAGGAFYDFTACSNIVGAQACQCSWNVPPGVNGNVVSGAIAESIGCPGNQNWSLISNSCVRPDCISPQVRNAGTGVCEVPVLCLSKKNTNLSAGKYDWGVDPEATVLTVCDGTCSAIFEGRQAVSRFLDNGKYHYLADGAYVYDGYSCSGITPLGSASDAKTETPPDTCPEFQVLGYVNFKAMCVDGGVAQNPHTPKAPARTNTSTTTVTNPDGSTTKISQTTHEDGSTTTTTTTTQPNGDTTVAGTTTPAATADPVDDMCKQNPSLPICKAEKSSFSGSCGAFVCEGDAIQCALASEIHKRNCTMFVEKTSLSELGDSLGNGTDSGVSTNPAKTENRVSVVLPSSLSMGGSITSRCLSDLSVQVMSSTVVIPFSRACPYLEIMGKIVVAMSLLVAARIVGGGVA